MRLVDADVADKWMRQNNAFIDAAILKAIPTIDAVPVVRCRECKYHKPIDYCTKHKQTGWFNDDFCSRGQRKEGV